MNIFQGKPYAFTLKEYAAYLRVRIPNATEREIRMMCKDLHKVELKSRNQKRI